MSEPGGATHLASGKVREIYTLDDDACCSSHRTASRRST